MKRIKLFEEFSEWDRDDFLLDLFTMTSTEVQDLFFEETKNKKPHIEKIRVILDSGLVDVRAKDKSGQTALHWACLNNIIALAKLLLDMGADVNAGNNHGATPLHSSCYSNFIEIPKLLLDSGADPNAKDENEWTPLHYACQQNSYVCVEVLLKAGADGNAENSDGDTPLHISHYSGSYDTQELLIQWGADTTIENDEGLVWDEYNPYDDWDDEYDGEDEDYL
jgi:ankyrin repeat protein